MGELREIPVSQLFLDPQNPRLDEVQSSQPATLQRVLTSSTDKLFRLARSIANNGLDPTNSFLAMPALTPKDRFIVLEGNRRLAALKILEHPELAAAVVSAGQLRALRELQKTYRARGSIETVPTYVVRNREEADQWLLLRHGGERGGAGLVPWGSQEKARFTQRRLGEKDPALQVLDFVAKSGALDEETASRLKDVARTNLDRLIADTEVRAYLGLARHHGVIYTQVDPTEAVKLLAKIVTALAHGDLNVTQIENQSARMRYVRSLGPAPGKGKRLAVAEPIDLAAVSDVEPADRPAKAAASAAARLRRTLIPRKAICAVANPKIAELFRELRTLDLDKYTNSGGTSFRVLLELSVDHYLVDRSIRKEDQLRAGLGQKVQEVATDLKGKGLMNDQQLKAARTITSSDGMMGVDTFHAYVHNRYFSATPLDLKKAWDNLAAFFDVIWRPAKGPA